MFLSKDSIKGETLISSHLKNMLEQKRFKKATFPLKPDE